MCMAPDVLISHRQVSRGHLLLCWVQFNVLIFEEDAIIHLRVEAIQTERLQFGLDDQGDPHEQDQGQETSEDSQRAEHASSPAHLDLKRILAKRVNFDGVETLTALVWAVRIGRREADIEGVYRLVVTRLANGI